DVTTSGPTGKRLQVAIATPSLMSRDQAIDVVGPLNLVLPDGENVFPELNEEAFAADLGAGHPCRVGPGDRRHRRDGPGCVGLSGRVDAGETNEGNDLPQALGEDNALDDLLKRGRRTHLPKPEVRPVYGVCW